MLRRFLERALISALLVAISTNVGAFSRIPSSRLSCHCRSSMLSMKVDKNMVTKSVLSGLLAFSIVGSDLQSSFMVRADDETTTVSANPDTVKKVPLFTKKSNDLQVYSDVSRGFRMLRPFGFNEFEGSGSGYAVKFASLISVDENVIVGSAPASAGKTTIADYGSVEQLGEKLAAKRGGKVVSAEARETEGLLFYQFQFEYDLDPTLPRTGRPKPTKAVELYELCVAKGRLWSVQATSNDRDFPARESTFRNTLLSFLPRM
jgi:PsbP